MLEQTNAKQQAIDLSLKRIPKIKATGIDSIDTSVDTTNLENLLSDSAVHLTVKLDHLMTRWSQWAKGNQADVVEAQKGTFYVRAKRHPWARHHVPQTNDVFSNEFPNQDLILNPRVLEAGTRRRLERKPDPRHGDPGDEEGGEEQEDAEVSSQGSDADNEGMEEDVEEEEEPEEEDVDVTIKLWDWDTPVVRKRLPSQADCTKRWKELVSEDVDGFVNANHPSHLFTVAEVIFVRLSDINAPDLQKESDSRRNVADFKQSMFLDNAMCIAVSFYAVKDIALIIANLEKVPRCRGARPLGVVVAQRGATTGGVSVVSEVLAVSIRRWIRYRRLLFRTGCSPCGLPLSASSSRDDVDPARVRGRYGHRGHRGLEDRREFRQQTERC